VTNLCQVVLWEINNNLENILVMSYRVDYCLNQLIFTKSQTMTTDKLLQGRLALVVSFTFFKSGAFSLGLRIGTGYKYI